MKIERHMIVHVIEDDVPPFMKALHRADWQKNQNLRSDFIIYKKIGNRSTKKQRQSPLIFPYALIDLAIETKSLREVLIIINYWLNLTKEEQKEKWNALRMLFVEPRRSSKRLHRYNPEKPQAVGIFDEQRFRKQRVLESASNATINGPKSRKLVKDPVVSNAQLRDWMVKRGEERLQCALRTTSERSSFNHERAFFEPIVLTASTVYTPVKDNGRPSNAIRDSAKVAGYARNKTGVVRHLDALFDILKADPTFTNLEELTGEAAFNIIDKVVDFHYVEDGKLPGIEAINKRKRGSDYDSGHSQSAEDSGNENDDNDLVTTVSQESMETMQNLRFEFLHNIDGQWNA